MNWWNYTVDAAQSLSRQRLALTCQLGPHFQSAALPQQKCRMILKLTIQEGEKITPPQYPCKQMDTFTVEQYVPWKIYRAISRGEEKYTVKQDTNEVACTTRLCFVPLLCKMV